MLRGVYSLLIAGALALVLAVSASAGWASDPPSNTPLGKLPASCSSAPGGKACINAGVYYLDKARAKVDLPAYKLPASFTSLTPAEQMFVLANLDRIQYGLPPITGLTAGLSHDALVSGVKGSADPVPSSTANLEAWTSNWAGGYRNAPMAYEAWMWDDGLGSDNFDCTAAHPAGCWDHRHDVLSKLGSSAVLAMGAAAGSEPKYVRGYAMLLVGGTSQYAATYSYTWTQAVAAGAGTHTYAPGTP